MSWPSHAMKASPRASALPLSPPGTLATCASSASLSVAADRLKRITWSIMMPLARPWCMSLTVDSAWAQECTAPRSFWKAMAPIIELISMSERAARSRPCFTAMGSARAAMRTPSSAMPSHSGW